MAVTLQLERDRAYRGLLDLILGGGVDPDTPLSERKLAVSLEIGRTPVREALRDLARDGILEVRARIFRSLAEYAPDAGAFDWEHES